MAEVVGVTVLGFILLIAVVMLVILAIRKIQRAGSL